MSASQQVRLVKIRDRAGPGDVHIAANQNRADRRARYERFRLLVIADRPRAHDRHNTGSGEILGEEPQRIFAESSEDQWSLDWFQEIGIAGDLLIQTSLFTRPRHAARRAILPRHTLCDIRRRSTVHLVNFHHGAAGCNPGAWLFGEYYDEIRDGAD